MPEDRNTIDALLTSLGRREDRLREHLPPPAEPPASRPPTPPLDTVRFILKLFAIMAGLTLVNDALAICFWPDTRVFVAREDQELQVWPDVRAFEAATGKRWVEQPPQDAELVATFHGARRDYALSGVGVHLALLGLSLLALRKLRQAEMAGPTS